LNINITLQEKLRDLREERKLRLVDVYEATGIPTSTLQRFESDGNVRIGYQEVEVLTRFYEVSADYLFGLTDVRQHRNVEIDNLHLSDEAVSELISGKLNNRLLCKMITHPDFSELLAALEVYVDRTITESLKVINTTYKVAIDKIIRKKVSAAERDEYLASLREVCIDPDEYLRFRLSQRFDRLAQTLYTEHAKESQAKAGTGLIETFLKQLSLFQNKKAETGSTEEAKLALLADQMGVDLKKATDEEKQSLLKLLSRSKFTKLFRRRK
jgi:transcriptional regulator with XRE-family HTH domain